MNLEEYLFNRMAEEAAEISQACTKIQSFGKDHRVPSNRMIATDALVAEINDVLGVADFLKECGIELFGIGKPSARKAKIQKILAYMQVSIDAGKLTLTDAQLDHLNSMNEGRPLMHRRSDPVAATFEQKEPA